MTPKLRLVVDRKTVALPTTWEPADGRALRWEPWQPPMRVFICPPPAPHPCGDCGSTGDPEMAIGSIMPAPGETFEWVEDVKSKRVPDSWYTTVRRVPAWPTFRLVAFRCADCGRVDVYDRDTDLVHPLNPITEEA